jgi:hypothetical protein
MRRLAVSIVLLLPVAGPTLGQSSGVNPDISAIPSFIYCPAGEDDCAFEQADGELNFQELELALQGYLNPYVRGEVFLAVHEDDGWEVEVEEAYAHFVRGLGPFQLRFGKYLVDWGSINPLHPHAYSWIFRPLVEERLFGEEGLNQIAANVNWSAPAGERGELKLSANLLRGDLADEHAHDDEEASEPGGDDGIVCVGPGCDDGICEPGDADCALVYHVAPAGGEAGEEHELAYHVRASWSTEIGPDQTLLLGVNGLRGTLEPALDRAVSWYGADVKYRWRPDKYRSLNLFAAWIASEADLEGAVVTDVTCVGPDCAGGLCPPGGVCAEIESTEAVRAGSISTSGGYLIGDWQFALRWNAGVKLDWSEGLETTDEVRRAETFVNFRIMEESTLFRFLFRREDGDGYDSAVNTTALQLVFSLGPHRPHTF